MDIEMGFPIASPLVYKDIFKWFDEKGYQPKGVFYEYYYNSPGEVPESELLTRIVIPLK